MMLAAHFGGQVIGALNREWSRTASADRFPAGSLENPLPAAPVLSNLALSGGKRIDSHRMARVLAFVGEHIERNFTVADLAAVACMSPAHFARSFKATTGQCPHEFVIRIRLALAKQMLADRHLPISDIAFSAGFSSQSNFSRAFRDATGMTPRGYRASLSSF
jgi:AraC family transcriptional regulator